MTALRPIFNSIWIGFCALSMLAQTRLLLGRSLMPGWLDGFVLGGAVFAYSFTHSDRRVKVGAWLAGLLGVACFFQPVATIAWQPAALVPALLWICYYGLRWPGNAGLRAVPAAKPLVVALAWGWVTVMLPVPPEQWGRVVWILIGRSAFIFALALAYDVADLSYDRRHGLNTLAGKLGVRKTFCLIVSALLLNVLCCGANFFLHLYGWNAALPLCVSLTFSAWWLWLLFQKTAWQAWQKALIDALMPAQFFVIWALKSIA